MQELIVLVLTILHKAKLCQEVKLLCQVADRKKSKPRQARKRKGCYSSFMISAKELLEARACEGRSPIAQIEQAHVFSPINSPDSVDPLMESPNGNGGDKTPTKETVVFKKPENVKPENVGKRYIKHPEFTNPPMG